jgi:enamine deaminase RidA (YjgF/YER057c/UK114 family)
VDISRHNPAAMGKPLGQYSHVTRVKASEFLFVAGQLHDGVGIAEQCDGIFGNIGAALESADANWHNVVQFTTYITHEDFIPEFMNWRLAHFPKMFGVDHYPPNTLLVVSRLVEKQFLIEIQTIGAL